MRTPQNLVKHELIGLMAKVAESKNPKSVGLSGKVIDETRNTLIIEKKDGKEAKLIKEGNVFIFDLGGQKVRVDGKVLVARPEDRIKKKFSRW